MAIALCALTDKPPTAWGPSFLKGYITYYLRGTASTVLTEDDLEFSYAPFRAKGPKIFGTSRSKPVKESTLASTLAKMSDRLTKEVYGLVGVSRKIRNLRQFSEQFLVFANIVRTHADGTLDFGYEAIGLFDKGNVAANEFLSDVMAGLIETAWPYYAHARWYKDKDYPSDPSLYPITTDTSTDYTEYEKRADVRVPPSRLRTGIRGLFWDNVLSEGHLAKVDVDRLRDRFAAVGVKVTQLTAPDNTRRVRIQLSGPPRDPNSEEIAMFEQELGHLLPQVEK